LNKELSNNFMVANKSGQVTDKLTGATKEQRKAFAGASKAARSFKFEYLSVMFAGMALDRAFGSLVKTQLELFGVSSMMGDAWTLVMLPIMELLTPIIYDLIEAFMSMPDETKLAIGSFVLLMAAFGKFLTITGQVVLAMMGFKMIGKDLAFNFAATGYDGLMSKLNNLKRIGAAGLGLYMIYQGLKDMDDKPIKGLGELLAGAGLLKYAVKGAGGKWQIIVGMVLMLSDTDIRRKFMKFFIWLGDKVFVMAEWIVDTLDKAFVLDFKNIENPFEGLGSEFSEEFSKMNMEGKISSDTLKNMWDGPISLAKKYQAGLDEISGKFEENTPEWVSATEKLADEFKTLINYQQEFIDKFNRIQTMNREMGGEEYSSFGQTRYASPFAKYLTNPLPSTSNLPVSQSTQNQNTEISVNSNYNINVSDKYEMERLIKDNNVKLVDEVRRQIT